MKNCNNKVRKILMYTLLMALLLVTEFPIQIKAGNSIVFIQSCSKGGFNIHGAVKTTYGDAGYSTQLVVGSSTVNASNGSASVGGVSLKTIGTTINNGNYLKIQYIITNSNNTAQNIKIGTGADIMIGSNDKAPCSVITDNGVNRGFVMSDGNNMFNVLLRDTYGVTNVNSFWLGSFSSYPSNYYNKGEKSISGIDSGAAWGYVDTIDANETKTYSFLVGIGKLNNPPEISDVSNINAVYSIGDVINISGNVYDEDVEDTVSAKYAFDDEEEQILISDIETKGSKEPFSGEIIIPELEDGDHTLKIWAMDNNGNISGVVSKKFNYKKRININGSILWKDNNDFLKIRPQNVKIHLMQNGKEIQSINAVDTFEFTNLPITDDNNNPYTYELKETINAKVIVNNITKDAYDISLNGYDFTNTLIPYDNAIPVYPEKNNSLTIKHNLDKEVSVTLKQITQSYDKDGNISYGTDYNDYYYNALVATNGITLNGINNGKYEIDVTNTGITLNNVTVDNNDVSILKENEKYYVIIPLLKDDISATVTLDLSEKLEKGYISYFDANNFFKIKNE